MSDEPNLDISIGCVPNPYEKDLCKHCGQEISGQVHDTGKSQHLMRCNPEDTMMPYGLIAESVGQKCTRPCTGTLKVKSRTEPGHPFGIKES